MTNSCDIPLKHAGAGISRADAPAGHESHRVPHVLENGEIVLDPWWGTIQPAQLHPDLPTVGELEVLDHIAAGGVLIDTRLPEYIAESGTIPGALAIPARDVTDHLELFDERPVVLFCNGPQCAATPIAVKRLLAAGVEPARMAYYRGGIQDWLALGLPIEHPE